tara:strand:- start:218 stop:463 length:246 start_codon:yes stop_codon:yes gene_type:complete
MIYLPCAQQNYQAADSLTHTLYSFRVTGIFDVAGNAEDYGRKIEIVEQVEEYSLLETWGKRYKNREGNQKVGNNDESQKES